MDVAGHHLVALPIAVMIMFSFNNPHGRYNFSWVGFTLKWYGPHLFDYPSLTSAMVFGLLIAAGNALFSRRGSRA